MMMRSMQSIIICTVVAVLFFTQRTCATENRGDLRLAFRKGTSSDSSGPDFAPQSDTPKVLLPGKPEASDPKEGDGDLFPFVQKHKNGKTIEGDLYDPKTEDGSGVSNLLTSVWTVAFNNPEVYMGEASTDGATSEGTAKTTTTTATGEGTGGVSVVGSDASATDFSTVSGGATSSVSTTATAADGGGTSTGTTKMDNLIKRCEALKHTTHASLDTSTSSGASSLEKSFGGVGGDSSLKSSSNILDEDDNSETTRAHHVTVLVVLLLIMFFLLAGADALYRYVYRSVQDRDAGSPSKRLRLKVVLDAASRELAILAFVLVVGYLFLWSGIVGSIEKDWLGYDEDDADTLTTLFGDVHFLLSSAMLVFMFLTVLLVFAGERVCRAWSKFEDVAAEDPQLIVWDYAQAFAYSKNKGRHGSKRGHAMDFLTLRMEFAPTLYRGSSGNGGKDIVATKTNCDETTTRFAHFNFAEYLSVRYGRELAKILTVGFRTWVLVELLMLLLTLPLLGSWVVQVACYVGFGYLVFLLHLIVRRKIFKIWKVVVRDAPSQKTAQKASKLIPEASKDMSKSPAEMKLHRTKSAELLNKIMHASVRRDDERLTKKIFWGEPAFFCGMGEKGGDDEDGDSFARAIVLQNFIRIVVILTAVSAILASVASGVAYNSAGTLEMVLVLLFAFVPVVLTVYQLRCVLERYVILTSVGHFRRPRVLQQVIDENRRRFGLGVAYLLDWIILARTASEIRAKRSGNGGDLETGGDGDEPKIDRVLMDSFFDSVATEDKKRAGERRVKSSNFVRWYRRYKLLCTKNSVSAKALKSLFKVAKADKSSKSLTKTDFFDLIATRDRIEMEVFGSRKAVRHIASLLNYKGAGAVSGDDDSSKRTTSAEELVKSLGVALQFPVTAGTIVSEKDVQSFMVPIFKEAGFYSKDRMKSERERRVHLIKLVSLVLKFAPASGDGLASRFPRE